MADKLLKSIKFPTLPDRYVIGDSTLTEEGAAADAKAVGEALATKADTKGRYEDLIVGGAEQLMADGYETDKEPYLFRTTGGSADVGNREYIDKIVGGTVAWNQLVEIDSTSRSRTANGVTFVDNRDGSYTFYTDANGATADTSNQIISKINAIDNGVYCVLGNANGSTDSTWYLYDGYSGVLSYRLGEAAINKVSGRTSPARLDLRVFVKSGAVITTPITVRPQVVNLTQMFGTTIADYIYNLEQSSAGTGVAWFRNYFPKDYYPYDAGTLRSVEGVSAHETVGFNQWDEEWEEGAISVLNGQNVAVANSIRSKNYSRCLGNTDYCIQSPNVQHYIMWYDGGKDFIGSSFAETTTQVATSPSDAQYFKIRADAYGTTYNHDICINLSDPTRNGEYKPYTKHTYTLDSSLTLRGVPKLVDGKLAFDGDVYQPSGEVQRRYGLRAYQSGDESLADAITDGTNTVYKLATPTTETADGYEQYQICDPSGTEAFVTTGIVPVGHETRYPNDLKKKIETAPDSPSTDGTYLMKRSGGKNAYMALPSTPSANGSYVLTVTVNGGSVSYSWTAKE